MWSTLLQQLSSTQGIPWSMVADLQFTPVTDSEENSYLSCCKLILIKLDQASLMVDDRSSLLENIILKKKMNLLPIIVNQFISCDESYRRDKLCHLIKQFLFHKNHLKQTFLQIVEKVSFHSSLSQLADDEVSKFIVNMPSNVANKMQFKTPQCFIPANYFTKICAIIFSVFSKIHKRINREQDCRMDFLCDLVGRISSSGNSDIVWKQLTSSLLNNCHNDFIWRRIGYKLVISQSDRNIEAVIRPLIMFAPDPSQVKFILKDGPLTSPKICYLLTEKFILNIYFDKHEFINNLIGYLANISSELFIKTLDNFLSAWSNGSALKYRLFDQQFYICCGLAVSAKYLKSINLDKQKHQKFVNCIIHAMQIYLASVLPEIRFSGLYIGKLFLTILQANGPQLDLEIEKTPEVCILMDLYGIVPHKIDIEEDATLISSQVEGLETSMSELKNSGNIDSENEEEEEDDFSPYDLSNDTSVDKTKKPIYVMDCISGLRDTENPDWNQICLKTATEIIDKNELMIEDYAEDFAITLLNLQDTFETPDFLTLKRDAMVKLITVAPITVATYLTGQFYDNNLVIETRLFIIETLSMASQEIAKSSFKVTSEANNGTQLITKIVPNDIVIAEAKWKTVVEDRIMSKTKIISKPRASKSYVNKFTKVAGYFFFPLMKYHDSHNITFNLAGEDYYLLGRLLYTLGIVLESTSQAPITQRMGRSLLDFLWAFRYHVESFVRQAIIFCLCMVFISVPSTYLLEYMQNDLIEFKKWLLDVTEKDSDKDCIERALNALYLLKQLIESEM